MASELPESPLAFSLYERSKDDKFRAFHHWQHDLLRAQLGVPPTLVQLHAFGQLCYWWELDYKAYASGRRKIPARYDLDDVPLICDKSIAQLSAWVLGSISEKQLARGLRELEGVGLFVSRKPAGLGLPNLREMNRKLITEYATKWARSPEARETMVDKGCRLWCRINGTWQPGTPGTDGAFRPARRGEVEEVSETEQCSRVETQNGSTEPCFGSRPIPILGDGRNPEWVAPCIGEEVEEEVQKNSEIIITKKIKDPTFDYFLDVAPPRDGLLHGNVLDSATEQEIRVVCKVLHEIHTRELLPFKWPRVGERPSKALYNSIVHLLDIMRNSWHPQISSPIWHPENPGTFRTTVIQAALAYRSRMEAMGDRPRDLHTWIYNDHPEPACRASGLMSEISRLHKAQQSSDAPDTRGPILEALSVGEKRRVETRIANSPDKNPPHPTAYWNALSTWHDFMERRGRDIRFHGILHRGWFRVPARPTNCAELLSLFDHYRLAHGQEPTSWLPKVGSTDWARFAEWLRGEEGGEMFVDLDYSSPLSDLEREETLVRAEIEETTRDILADHSLAYSSEVIVSSVDVLQQGIRSISPIFERYADLLLRLARCSRLIHQGKDRIRAARALEAHARVLPDGLEPNEEALAADFACGLMLKLRNYWRDNDPELLERAKLIGLFSDLPVEESLD